MMKEQLRPIVRFLRWYCQPPDFMRAVVMGVPPALRLPLVRAVVGLGALYVLCLALHLPPVLLSVIGVSIGCSVTLARGWTSAMNGTPLPDVMDVTTQVGQDTPPPAVDATPRAVDERVAVAIGGERDA